MTRGIPITKIRRQRAEREQLEARLRALDRRLSVLVSSNAAVPLHQVVGLSRKRHRLCAALARGTPVSEKETTAQAWHRAVAQHADLATLSHRATGP